MGPVLENDVEQTTDTFQAAPTVSSVTPVINWLTVALFVLGITLPSLQMLFPMFSERSSFENRSLASLPSWPQTLPELTAYPHAFEDYFDDHFGFRNTLISWNNRVRVHWLAANTAQAPSAGPSVESAVATADKPEQKETGGAAPRINLDWRRVVPGNDGWLFVSGGPVDEYYQHPTYTPGELNLWKLVLMERQRWLAERGIQYVVAVCPHTHAVYSEFLPDEIANWPKQRTRADQLVEALAGTGVNFLYLRDAMVAAKPQGQVYHRTDHHWNEFGAYVGYREIMQVLSASLPQLTPQPLSNFDFTTREFHTGSAANILGLPDVYWENAIYLVPKVPRVAQESEKSPYYVTTTVPDSSLPRAVIFHDSFIFNIRPFLAEHFSRARYVWKHVGFDKELIEAEKPQVVIQLFAEHRLTTDLGVRSATGR